MNDMESKKRIVIAEDDRVPRDVLAEKLQKSGYLVDKAFDGVEALEKIRLIKPDCVLLDVLMPRKGGMEVLEEMHRDALLSDVPVIIISNSGQPVEIARARELGAKEFLIKAVFDPNEVLEKVRLVLSDEVLAVEEGGPLATIEATTTVGSANIATNTEVVKKVEQTAGAKVFVLVIEDDKFLRELLVRKLTDEGFDVKNAIEADAAFAILAERKPQIVLCDIILPGIDGFEILTRIKADPKNSNVPVVMLSNLGQKEDIERAMSLGAKDFMVKANFTLDEIVTKVRSILGQ